MFCVLAVEGLSLPNFIHLKIANAQGNEHMEVASPAPSAFWALQCFVKARHWQSCVFVAGLFEYLAYSLVHIRQPCASLAKPKCSERPGPFIHTAYPTYLHTAYTHTSTRSNEARGDGSHCLGGCLGFDGGERARYVRKKRERPRRRSIKKSDPPRRDERCVCESANKDRGGGAARSAKFLVG